MFEYIIAVFSLRTSTLQFNSLLVKNGIRSLVIETPKSASASCGISVRFDVRYLDKARDLLASNQIKNFVRFYRVITFKNETRLMPVM